MYFRSLRAKITLAYYLVGVVFLGLASFAYVELKAIEEVIASTKAVTDFFDAAREMQNQEKNLLLYRRPGDFTEVENRYKHALLLLDLHRARFALVLSVARVDVLREGLMRYRETLGHYWQRLRRSGEHPADLATPLHAARLVVQEESELLARTADRKLASAIASLRRNLIGSIAVVTVLLVVTGQLLSRRVVKPLRDMEGEMDAVAKGQVKKLELRSTDKEIASLTAAFNQVLSELAIRQEEAARVEKLATLGTMLSGMAHEINNPLSNISTSIQILLEEFGQSDPDFQHQLLQQVDQETVRARAIVRSLLDFAHDRAARRERIFLADVVDDTLRLYGSQIPAGVTLEVDVAADLSLYADRRQLQQVLLNLVKNAVEASGEQGMVEIRARAYPPPNGTRAHRFRVACEPPKGVDIAVCDRGAGISPEALARVFDPFFTTKDVGEGTGLGLFVVHEIAVEHGGAVEARSREGGGTVFHLRLPVGDAIDGGVMA